MTDAPRPLSGLEITECASFVAGPTGGMTLAQLGADVVRIDPIGGGSDHRRWPLVGDGDGAADADSYYWTSLNKGKRSIAVDMRSDEGRELVVALATAPGENRGVLVDNVVGRRWMSNEVLVAQRPDLVHLRVQGYPDGSPAVDYTVNAEIGIPGITGPEAVGSPVNHALPAWDLVAGLTVSTGVLAALYERSRSGRGAYVELALSDIALAGVANLGWLSEVAGRGSERSRHGNHVYGSFGVDFACSDGGRVMVVALTPGQWSALCEATGTAEVFAALATALGADWADEADRYRHRETITAILKPWFASRDRAQAGAELDAARVLWGKYQGMGEVVAEHRAGRHAVLADATLPGGAEAITARSPMRWNGDHGGAGAAPELGRETDEVLAARLGLSAAEISALRSRGVVAGPRG
ncbi:CoA transferase [Saccharopolyspora indica]|uniref:CoA transferase n=1 Tax=Saccharopolyspora indica TaxID=1229659 RepID=UPI0022EB0EA5|nr:CoA transferase [Saccharopolyspora indica]MDA3644240.1 CoA transferase [Saccharopolyspora indica]